MEKAVHSVQVDVAWLPYGSITSDFAAWTPMLTAANERVDLVILLVRVSDLDAAHPELRGSASAGPKNDQFLHELAGYNASPAFPPVVLIMCRQRPDELELGMAREQELIKQARAMPKVHVVPSSSLMTHLLPELSSQFEYYDAATDRLKHAPYTQAMQHVLALAICRQICRLYRGRKKVIVLDCDNTLWGGAVAELGADNIVLSAAFLAVQQFMVAQQQKGMVLCLCSKNVRQDVMNVFTARRNDMPLCLETHITLAKVNWEPKSKNIQELAEELSLGTRLLLLLNNVGRWLMRMHFALMSLGLDSFIFMDDNAVECNEVASTLPMVTVIHLKQGFSIHRMAQEWIFDDTLEAKGGAALTAEDTQRTLMYQQSLQRNKLLQTAASHTAFLSSLGVKISFETLQLEKTYEGDEEDLSFARVVQLHQRTNQFNIATSWSRKLDSQTLEAYIRSERHAAFCAHVTDRFGHYGLVSVVLCRADDKHRCLRVDSFLLSCRALNRGVEHAMVRKITEFATEWQLSAIELSWEPTERNEPARVFFSSLSAFQFASNTDQQRKILDRREDKLCASSIQLGSWLTIQEKAASIAFLQSERPASSSSRISGLFKSMNIWWRSVVAFSINALAKIVPRWLWIVLGFGSPVKAPSVAFSYSMGLLRQTYDSIHELNAFFAQYSPPAIEGAADECADQPVADDALDEDAMGKFRRKARHQSKLALQSHLHEENQDTIWSANRKPETMATSVFTPAVCATPSCQSNASRQCDLLRCRNCCYKMQRLLTRATGHGNEHARLTASTALATDYGLMISDVAIRDSWCAAHQNTRRKGGP